MKKIYICLLILFLSSCGYSPIYEKTGTNNLTIVINNIEGNSEMNNLIKNQIKLYSTGNSENKFFVNIKSNLKKSVISKTSTGTTSNYELYVNAEFEITYKDKKDKFNYEERFNIKNISDSFKQRNYENVIKANFASSIRKKLILKLLSMK